MTRALTYRIDRRHPIAVVRLSGELSHLSGAAARLGLLDSLADEPTAVVVDLSRVTATPAEAVTLLRDVAEQANRWPGAPLLLCRPSAAVAEALRRTGTDRRVRTYPTAAMALAVAAGVPVPPRRHRRLAPTSRAPRLARDLAALACAEWDLPHASVPAQILCSELVTNAVRHAGTTIDLSVTLRAGRLLVAVRDGAPQPARLRTPGEADDHGRGLLIVDTVASAWGNVPTALGKAVWAALPVARDPSRVGAGVGGRHS